MNNKYIEWLKGKNLSPKTINSYHKTINYYGNVSLTTENIIAFLKKFVQTREPATCQTYASALKSYAEWQRVVSIDWGKIKNLIPSRVKKFFTTINQEELQKLKSVRFEKNQWLYQRNNLVVDFLFYSGVRVSELVNIKHRDWEGNSLRIHGKGNKIRYVFIPDFLIHLRNII